MTDEKTYWCPNCQVHAAESATCLMDPPPGFMRQRVHNLCDRPVFRSNEPMPANVRVAALRPRGFGKTAEDRYFEADRAAWHAQEALTDAFVSNAYRIHVQHTEQTLKEMIQGALKLVEDNPRNEPMRTPVPRSAVEQMLAEDLAAISTLTSSPEGRAQIATALFDAGWRPTIDRLVR